MRINYSNKIYNNNGNIALLNFIPDNFSPSSILDIGFGNGANIIYLKKKFPNSKATGITLSHKEALIGKQIFDDVLVADVSGLHDDYFISNQFDLIILSHILEHLSEPEKILKKILLGLNYNGICLIAVPNIVVFRNRLDLFIGKWNYTESGILDQTHLRFFTYNNINSVLDLKSLSSNFKYIKGVDARLPFLGRLRSNFLGGWVSNFEKKIGKVFPNLFGWQILLVIRHH